MYLCIYVVWNLKVCSHATHIIQGTPIDFSTEYFKDIEYFTNKNEEYLFPPNEQAKNENLIIDRVTIWDVDEIVIP